MSVQSVETDFRYSAAPIGGGKKVKGTARARDEATVSAELRSRGLVPTQIVAAGAGLNRSINISLGPPRAKPKALVVMSRQAATMLKAGSSLVRTLDSLTRQTEDQVLLGALRVVTKDVKAGKNLSTSMSAHEQVFPPLMTSMVAAGESGGFLDESMVNIADTLERDYELRESVKSALVYPVAVTVFAVLALYGMVIFLVPIFAGLYDDISDGQTPLPLLTRMVVAASSIATWSAPVVFVAIIALSAWYRGARNRPKVRERVDAAKVRLPIFGPLMRKTALARFSANLAQLVRAGVPVDRALEVVAPTIGNYQMEISILKARDAIRSGKPLSEPLGADPDLWPVMMRDMLTTGEESGQIDSMIAVVGAYYRREVDETTKKLKSLLDPVMIVVVGGLVGLIVVALYLPYFNIGQVVSDSGN